MFSQSRITAIGTYVPERILTNDDLSALVETSDEWIVQRTGIKERRIAAEDEFCSHLAIRAVENLRSRFQTTLSDVDLVIVCTSTPDYSIPSVASQIQAHFQIPRAGAIDLNGACAGFAYGLQVANGMIASGLNRKILVVGSETFSKIVDYTDRSTCILFGDGAGAVLVERDGEHPCFLASFSHSQGEGGRHLYRTALSNRMGEHTLSGDGRVVQNGREVYRWAVSTIPQGMASLMEQAALPLSRVDWFIPHSANLRIVESICERSGFPLERALTSMVPFGNTSAASIPLALDLGLRDGKVKQDDLLLLYGFGSGLVQSALLIRWHV